MKTKKFNGVLLEKMMKNGLANLREHEEEVNRLNVFPVADGDTGTNMCLTLENGIRFSKTNEVAGFYLKSLSQGMLLGARGNSGVILSQFFKGFYTELARCTWIGPGELRNGLIRGYRCAYESVVKPVEGTILTVTREGIEHIRGQITRNSTTEEILSMYIAEMRKSLSYTPEILPVLKESCVVDSGAQGFIYIIEGMLGLLYGDSKYRRKAQEPSAAVKETPKKSADFSLFNENSRFELGYCTEFILQLLKDTRYSQRFELRRFISDLEAFGDSLVVVQDGRRVKVHIHTLRPEKVIALAREYGEFLTFKLENMQLQHNEVLKAEKKKLPHKALAMVSVVNGPGLQSLFEELGCDVVIRCEETMNASSQEFVKAFEQIDADDIVVLPNNKNVVLAAEQAVELFGGKNIHILPTHSVAQGYFAIAMDVPDRENSFRIASMRDGLEGVATIIQTVASRDYSYHGFTCRAGENIALLDGELVCVSDSRVQAIMDTLRLVPDIGDRETCVVFCGEDVTGEERDELEELISEEYPLLEAEFIDGGQKVYNWMLGIS